MKIETVLRRVSVKDFGWIVFIMILFIAMVITFLYVDRGNAISDAIQSWGVWGALLALLFMTVICLTPLPSEGLLILCMKIYGVFTGILLGWAGSLISALFIFYMSRFHWQKFMRKVVTQERFEAVDRWVKQKGTLGLFIARLLPFPAFAVNYIAGVIPSVKLWPYTWTAALTIIPYYLGTAFVFIGILNATWLWLMVGVIAIGAFWASGWLLKRRNFSEK